MYQKQTDILLVFLAVTLVLFSAYPLLIGGYPPSGDPFGGIVIISLAILITLIYILIQEPVPPKIDEHKKELGRKIVKTIIGSVIFIVISVFVAILMFPDKATDIEIGILAGVISGTYLSIFHQN